MADGDQRFLDPKGRSHADAMAALPADHWERLVAVCELTGAGAVLDVACGSGDWLVALAATNERVVGVDADPDMLELAHARTAAAHNVELRQMRAEQLDFADGAFDALTCFTALPYLEQSVAIREMARVLEPGGKLVLGTVGTGYYAKHAAEGIRHRDRDTVRYGLDPILVSAGRTVRGDRFALGALRVWGPRSVRRLLEGEGLEVTQIAYDPAPVDPTWPRTFLGQPLYVIAHATKRA